MKINKKGLELIKRFEGFRSHSYRDVGGVWTIGYGHTSAAGTPKVLPNQTISLKEAEKILRDDIALFEKGVRDEIKRELNDDQFSALVSFTYNVGLENFRRSSVLKAVNDGDFARVPQQLQLWNKASGKILLGLVRRRAAEAKLFIGSSAHSVKKKKLLPLKKKKIAFLSSSAALESLLQRLSGWQLIMMMLLSAAITLWAYA